MVLPIVRVRLDAVTAEQSIALTGDRLNAPGTAEDGLNGLGLKPCLALSSRLHT